MESMDAETRTFLEQMEQRLASKSDLVALETRITSQIIARIDESQEELARMVKHGFDQTQHQFSELWLILRAIAEAVDADTSPFAFVENGAETLRTYRKDIDNLTRRVKALEGHPSKDS